MTPLETLLLTMHVHLKGVGTHCKFLFDYYRRCKGYYYGDLPDLIMHCLSKPISKLFSPKHETFILECMGQLPLFRSPDNSNSRLFRTYLIFINCSK